MTKRNRVKVSKVQAPQIVLKYWVNVLCYMLSLIPPALFWTTRETDSASPPMAMQYLSWVSERTGYDFGSTDPLAAVERRDVEAFSYCHKGLS